MVRTFTLENVPWRMDYRVMIPNQILIRFDCEDLTGHSV